MYLMSANVETDSISLKLSSRSSFCHCMYITQSMSLWFIEKEILFIDYMLLVLECVSCY